MEIFNSQDKVYKSQLPYRMSFRDSELEVTRGKDKLKCISIPDNDSQKSFLENAIADFIMFNPDGLKVIEMVMLNSYHDLDTIGVVDRSQFLHDLLKWMKSTRFRIMESRLAKKSLAEEGFEAMIDRRPCMEHLSGTRFEVNSRYTDMNDYSISLEDNQIIKVREISREGSFYSKVFSTNPNWGESLLTEQEFKKAVGLCIRLNSEKFYQIADELKKFINFDENGKVTNVTIQYFYLCYMASEEAKLRSVGKWKLV